MQAATLNRPALPRFSLPDDPRTLSVPALEYAQAAVLCDVDSFADDLYAACMGKAANSEWAMRVPGRLEVSDAATVLHALLASALADDGQSTLAAARLLLQRYLDRNADRIVRIASECEL